MAEWLNARGFSLSMTPAGKLLVRSPGGRWPTDEERRAYIDGAPLLAGWLAGKPLRCELFHKDPVEAVTVVDLDIDVCEEHAA